MTNSLKLILPNECNFIIENQNKFYNDKFDTTFIEAMKREYQQEGILDINELWYDIEIEAVFCPVKRGYIFTFDSHENKTLFILKYL